MNQSGLHSTVAAIVLPLVTGCTLASAPAQATPVASNLPALPSAAAPAKTLATDVDGDKTYDTVQLFDLGSDSYRLTVTTTKGATSSVTFTSQLESPYHGDDPIDAIWYGASTLDGVKGSELVVNLLVRDESGRNGDFVALGVYTWRGGALVAEKAPASRLAKGWNKGTSNGHQQGYRFFTRHGHRHVNVSDLTRKSGLHPYWTGKIIRSVWRHGKWVKVSTRSYRATEGKALAYLGLTGSPMLLGVARTDIDGDGAPDELRYYRTSDTGTGAYKVKVTTAKGKVASKSLASPLIGAAALDGVAGAELAFEADSEDNDYLVLTWRKGRLAYETAPGKTSASARASYWDGCGDESGTTLTFSTTADGSRHLVRTCSYEDASSGDPATTSNSYVWRNGLWVFFGTEEGHPTPDEVAALGRGIQGVTLIKP